MTIASDDKRVAAIILMAGGSRPVNETVSEQELYQRAMRETANVADKTKVNPISQTLTNQFEAAKLPQNAETENSIGFGITWQAILRSLPQK